MGSINKQNMTTSKINTRYVSVVNLRAFLFSFFFRGGFEGEVFIVGPKGRCRVELSLETMVQRARRKTRMDSKAV